MDWTNWHKQYDVSSLLQARLRSVCSQIRACLLECATGPVRVVSICAGDGRDVIEALRDHPRRSDVCAWLLETDAPSLERARSAARAAGVERQLRFQVADATLARNYRGIVPADVLIISGVLGHQANDNMLDFFKCLPMLCGHGGFVIWDRHLLTNGGGEHIEELRALLRNLGFQEMHIEATAAAGFAVSRARFNAAPLPLDPDRVLFEFTGLDRMWGRHSCLPRQARKPAPLRESDASIPACFERQALVQPHRIALGSGAWQPTYEELNGTANCLATELLVRGGTTADRVALLMRHDTPLIAAVLGVLKARRIVVVLNPTDPPARLRQVLDDADARIIFSDAKHQSLAEAIVGKHRSVITVEVGQPFAPAHAPDVPIAPEDVAFLVYTSGTTGRPKGVMRTHGGAMDQVRRLTSVFDFRRDDRVTLLASLSGGQGISTALCTLLNGATLCPFPIMERGVTGLADWMRERGVTVYVSAASVFRHFVKTLESEQRFAPVRLVWLASEPATSDDFASWRRHFSASCRLMHTLSSSETGTITQSCLTHNDRVAAGRLPAGKPVAGIEIRLLDEHGNEVPEGEPGEIVVRGAHLSPGYWRNDALTAAHFTGSGADRVFRSADRACRSTDGSLVFAGRSDARLKIRGYRVEPSEVEDALRRQAAVESAAVCGQTRGDGETELVAYVVCRASHTATSAALRAALSDTLPLHEVPAQFVFLSTMPLTAHGKIDRDKLRQANVAVPQESPAKEPETETEAALAAFWSQSFSGRTISRDDNFFDLGGDSLIAAVVAARVHSAWGIELELRTFAKHATLVALAARIDELRRCGSDQNMPALVRVSRAAPLPLSYTQERMWRFSQTPAAAAGYTVSNALRMHGPLNIAVLSESINTIVRRHEILRTTFAVVKGRLVQVVHQPTPVSLPLIDFSSADDARECASRFYEHEIRRPFALGQLPLVRFALVRVATDEHWLVRVNHHIISDGWSWTIFIRELGLIYEALLRGEPAPLAESEPLQYADYAAWQWQALRPDGAAYRNAVAWWRARFRDSPPPLEFSFKRRVEATLDASAGLIKWPVAPQTASRLQRLCREQGVTYFAARLAAFAALLAKEAGCPDIILGAYVTNRSRAELQNMFGCFANLATLRFHCAPTFTFRQWLGSVRDIVVETHARCDLPYEQLCEELRREGAAIPEIRALFAVHEQAPERFGGMELTHAPAKRATMPWGFTLTFSNKYGREQCSAAFDANLYDPDGVRTMIERLLRLLDAASCHPDWPLRALLETSYDETAIAGAADGDAAIGHAA